MKEVTLRLHDAEYQALHEESAALRLKPEELLWNGLDAVMGSIDQPTDCLGFIHSAVARFDKGELSEWAK